MRWTDRAFGEENSTKHEQLALPFMLDPQGTSGTVIVLGLLRAAQARGARYISDVAIAIQIRRGELPVECVSRIVLAGAPTPGAEPPPASPAAAVSRDTTLVSFEPAQVEARVIDRELRCGPKHTLVVRPDGGQSTRFDGAVGPHTFRGGMPTPGGGVEWQDHCELQPVERTVRRYDHYLAARFAPPDLPRLGRDHADRELVETPPMCRPIELRPGAPLVQRIQAELFYSRAR